MCKHWFACELHCHTIHSDGAFTPESLMQTARERLLDGIALTDHNTVSGVAQASREETPALLPGVELTTFYGHMPVLAPSHWVEWRDLDASQGDLLLSRAIEAGGTPGIAHPFQLGTPICTGGHWDYEVKEKDKIAYLEIWSEGCPYLNSSNRRAIALWHSLLDQGLHITPTMGRDWHRPTGNPLPAACTYLGCSTDTLTGEAMLAAIRAGHTVVSAGPLFTVVTDDGQTAGDTVPAGRRRLLFSLSFERSDRLNQETILCEKLILRSNAESIAYEIAFDANPSVWEAEPVLETGHWYSAELWGKIGEKENQLIAVSAALFAF